MWLVFGNGQLTVGSGGPRKRADCVIYGPPSSLLLVMTGRLSPMGAFLRLKSASWGRKPWLGLTLSRRFRSI
ncbi:MAG: SCP2 sterol-binding domain-containing protein [Nocardiaceae bacterium]|nr:SCP2 sterol-binding domain-containing protein [Nocardiaceae bacterium]